MYNQETRLILLMLGISESQYREHLYALSEKWEDKYSLQGIYQHQEFRTWWAVRANSINQRFFRHLTLSKNDQYRYHHRDEAGDHFIYGAKEIRSCWYKELRKLIDTPFNNALLELIDFKTKKVKTHAK